MKAHRVLIGSAGTATCFGSVTALRRTWGDRIAIVTMDINPRHLVTASLLSDHFVQVPLSAAPEFPERIEQIVGQYDIDTYLPLLPQEIAIASRLKEQGRIGAATQILAPSASSSSICCDKLQLCAVLEQNRIVVPRYSGVPPNFVANTYFVKPKDGVGSRAARRMNGEDLDFLPTDEQTNLLVQEVCSGPELTIDCFFDQRQDRIRAICRERVEVKLGVSTKCRLFEDDELTGVAYQIARVLGLTGTFCFQVMKNGADQWAVTDVNPRPGAGTIMCWTTGNDFISAGFAYAWNEDCAGFFQPLSDPVYVTRQYSDFLMGAAQ